VSWSKNTSGFARVYISRSVIITGTIIIIVVVAVAVIDKSENNNNKYV
jgi:hypothetical protein